MEDFLEISDKQPVLGRFDACRNITRFPLIRPELEASAGLSVVSSELSNNGRFRNKVSICGFENRNESAIYVFVPLSFLVKVGLAVLERNLFGSKREDSSLGERTEIMRVDAEVLGVESRFGEGACSIVNLLKVGHKGIIILR